MKPKTTTQDDTYSPKRIRALIDSIPLELRKPEGLPHGYQTVWGYLAKHEPETLAGMATMDVTLSLIESDVEAEEAAILLREPIVLLEAPSSLRRAGRRLVAAHTKTTLLRVFPI